MYYKKIFIKNLEAIQKEVYELIPNEFLKTKQLG